MWKLAVIFAVAIVAVQAAEPIESDEEVASRKAAVSFDYFTLSLQWPQTSCWNLNHKFPAEEGTCSICKMPKTDGKWTIHGLWPDNNNGKHPASCDKSQKFDARLLSSSLTTQLEEKWPSFKLSMGSAGLWKHEWEKHGTCALGLEETNSLPKYFSTTLKLADQYNLGPVLEKAGIVPGGEYQVNDIFQALENAFGIKVNVVCNKNAGEQYLGEARICFDKSFQLIDCASKHTSNCKSGAIVYPKTLKTC